MSKLSSPDSSLFWQPRHQRKVIRVTLSRKKPKIDAKWKFLDQQEMEPPKRYLVRLERHM